MAIHDDSAERALLSAILADNRAYDAVSDFLQPEHFVDAVHGRIYEAMARLIESGQAASPATLATHFEDGDSTQRLAVLASALTDVVECGRIVYDCFLNRELIALGKDISESVLRETARDEEDCAISRIEKAEQALYDLGSSFDDGGFSPIAHSLFEAIVSFDDNTVGQDSAIATGLVSLDRILGGLQRSELLVLAGPSGTGKTWLAIQIACHAASSHLRSDGKEGAVVGYFSPGLSARELALRMISTDRRIALDDLRRRSAKVGITELQQVYDRLKSLSLYIDDTSALTPQKIRTRAGRLKRQVGLDLMIVDSLRFIDAEPGGGQHWRRDPDAALARGLKTLALELNAAVIAISDISVAEERQASEQHAFKGVREVGRIGFEADTLVFLHQCADGDVEVTVAKNRQGSPGKLRLAFDGRRFRDHTES